MGWMKSVKFVMKSTYAPSLARYKVYIIDEVHMLSTGAFNALLKDIGRTITECGLYFGNY